MSVSQPINDVQAKSSQLLIIYVAIGFLATLTVFGLALALNFSVFSSMLLTLVFASPLAFSCVLLLNFLLSYRKTGVVVETAEPFMD